MLASKTLLWFFVLWATASLTLWLAVAPWAGIASAVILLILFAHTFMKGYRQIEAGDNPEAALYMVFGKVKAEFGPGTRVWIPPFAENLFRLAKTSLKREVVTVKIQQFTQDRIGVEFEATIEVSVIPKLETIQKFYTIGWEKAKNVLEKVAKDAAWKALSRYTMEDVLGFTVHSEKAGGKESSAEAEETEVSSERIAHTKKELKEAIFKACEKKTEDWGLTIADLQISDVTIDEASRKALESEEQVIFMERGDIRRTEKHLSQARLVKEAKEKGVDADLYSLVVELENARLAAEKGGPLDLLVQNLLKKR